MQKTIFVISDLHLGGKPGFQMCSPEGQKRLAAFIRWAKEQHSGDRDVHLVIAGDIVDFLAEEEFKVFTSDDQQAARKLENIFVNYVDVWDALRDFVTSGAALTMILGNHDIELSLPGPFRLLRERLGLGRVDFVFDNQAFVAGVVLIEHGNRYDLWNVVPHNELRQIRSALSRREPPRELPAIPGSEMVCRVMNGLKENYQFIDLLKPETQAMVPLLTVLEPEVLTQLHKVVKLYRNARQSPFDAYGIPINPSHISATSAPHNPEVAHAEQLLEVAQELAGIPADTGQISTFETLKGFKYLWQAASEKNRKEIQVDRLYRALKIFAIEHHLAFDMAEEDETYLKPARQMAERGFQVIVFGHTHLAKKVTLTNNAVYLNSGTWADIIRLPESLFQMDETIAKAELATFANDLALNNLANWRHLIASYVRIDLQQEHVLDAALFYFQDASNPAALSPV